MHIQRINYYSAFADIKAWMAMNCLHFNDKKTEVMLLGWSDTSKIVVALGPQSHHLTPAATDLGVKINSKLDVQISSAVKFIFFHLR